MGAVVSLTACAAGTRKYETIIAVDDNVSEQTASAEPAPADVGPAANWKLVLAPASLGPVVSPAAVSARSAPRTWPPYLGRNPCRLALKGESPVARACSEGGLKKADGVMQEMVRRARGQGVLFDCENCHQDDRDWTRLTADAELNFLKLMFLSRD